MTPQFLQASDRTVVRLGNGMKALFSTGLRFGLVLMAASSLAQSSDLDELKTKAQAGDPKAQMEYALSREKRGQLSEAIDWFRKAAEQGELEGLFKIAEYFADGRGVARDEAESRKWYEKALALCHKGCAEYDAKAMYRLGYCYAKGRGVPRDKTESYKWLALSAAIGNPDAAKERDLLIRGMSRQDLAAVLPKAEKFIQERTTERIRQLEAQATKGERDAQYTLGLTNSARGDFTLAATLFRKAADQGHPDAQVKLGELYFKGQGIAQNVEEAIRWIRRAAESNSARGQFILGYCYMWGVGLVADSNEAEKLWRKAAAQSFASAQNALGELYCTGKARIEDYQEAARWFNQAAAQGLASAQCALAESYFWGSGRNQNSIEAARWLRLASEQGDAHAQSELAVTYSKGLGVPLDDAEAYKWVSLAAAHNDAKATENLRLCHGFMDSYAIAEGQRRASLFVPRKNSVTVECESLSLFLQVITENHAYSVKASPETADTVRASGTGFFITEDGFLITNEHVVKSASSVQVKVGGKRLPAKIVMTDPALDLALLKVEGQFAALPVDVAYEAKLGDAVFTIGFPNILLQGTEPKYTDGKISSLAGFQDDPHQFQISVPVQPGNSGGPLATKDGTVIGVIVARISDAAALSTSGALPQNVNYAIKGGYMGKFLLKRPELLKRIHTRARAKTVNPIEQAQKAVVLVEIY